MAAPGPTRIGLVIDKLIEIFGQSTNLQVTDGPHVGELMDEAICAGFTDGPDRPGYTVAVVRQEGMGRPRLAETFTVRSLLTISSGDINMQALRARAVELLGAIDTALRDVDVVDGVWDRAGLSGEQEWIPIQYAQGATVNVFFSVEGASLL